MKVRLGILVRVFGFASVACAAMPCALASDQPQLSPKPRPGLKLSQSGAAVRSAIDVAGAVERPGTVSLSPLGATLEAALDQAGGTLPGGYRFATVVLRAAADAGADRPSGRCLAPGDLQALLMLHDDAILGASGKLRAGLRDGALHRVDMPALVHGDADARSWPLLQDGDIVAVPARTGLVYVTGPDGAVTRIQHEPSATADEYLEKAPAAARAGRHVLVYPDGRRIELSLDPWTYQPTMVPPGSLIAPDADCLPGA